MNSRTAAREIVILAMPQLPKDNTKIGEIDYNQIILALSRSLSDYAKKNLTSVSSDLQRIEKYLLNVEIEHPDNEERTSQIKPVLIPDTEVLREQDDRLAFPVPRRNRGTGQGGLRRHRLPLARRDREHAVDAALLRAGLFGADQ